MMRFKKWMALVLVAVMALTVLTACGSDGGKATPTQKSRYLSGINANLKEKVPGAKKLTLEDESKARAAVYKQKSENQKVFNDKDAKQNAGIDGAEYIAFRMRVTIKDTEKQKIAAISDGIYNRVSNYSGVDALRNNEYKLDYAWGTTEENNATVFVYIVLRRVK